MIQISNLEKAYGTHVIFDRACFIINAGERVGLVGRNGHGKTTLFRMILGQERPDGGVIGIPANYSIGHLSQHIHFTEDTVLKEGCLSLRPSEDGRDETYRVETVLHGLGFSGEDFSGDPRQLSGGFQVRLNLAKVLISKSDLLLLDEPTNYLDILSVRWLVRFLQGWKGELILITHDREFMDSVTTHTMGIHRCRIKKVAGTTEKLYDQILLEEEVYEKTRMNDEKKRKETEQFINRFRAQANKARAVQSRIKALQKKGRLEKLSEIRTLDFSFNGAPFHGRWLLKTEDLSFSFGPGFPLLIDRLSFSVNRNDRVGIIGKNGKGKTTLLNLLAGELLPQNGNITRHPDVRLGYFGQTNIVRLDPRKTVEEEILDVHPDHNRRAVRSICGIMMFDGDKALKKISVLSGGERSRVLLGKLLVSPSNLLLLDEPTNHLDMESIDSLIEAIDAFDGTVMIVTHSEMVLKAVATRFIIFDDDGVSLFEGTYQDFLDKVGWKNETQTVAAEKRPASPFERSGARKDLRRIRAEIISERSRTLGALQKRIEEIEGSIMELEEKIDGNTKAILEASQMGNGMAISRFSREIHESREQIEILFDELEALTAEHDAKAGEFEERLNAAAS